jgi:hypothetical protein
MNGQRIIFDCIVVGSIGLILLVVVRCFYLLRKVYRSAAPLRWVNFYSLICSLVATSGYFLWMFTHPNAPRRNDDGLEMIGMIALPFFIAFCLAAGFAAAWPLVYSIRFVLEKLGIIPMNAGQPVDAPSKQSATEKNKP